MYLFKKIIWLIVKISFFLKLWYFSNFRFHVILLLSILKCLFNGEIRKMKHIILKACIFLLFHSWNSSFIYLTQGLMNMVFFEIWVVTVLKENWNTSYTQNDIIYFFLDQTLQPKFNLLFFSSPLIYYIKKKIS